MMPITDYTGTRQEPKSSQTPYRRKENGMNDIPDDYDFDEEIDADEERTTTSELWDSIILRTIRRYKENNSA